MGKTDKGRRELENQLTVHKNKLENRRKKELRKEMISATKYLSSKSEVSSELAGFTIVAWNKRGESEACWDSGNIPTTLIGEHTKQVINRTINMMEAESVLGLFDG